MIPIEKVKSIINTYEKLEKELSSSSIDKKDFVKKSKEYSNIGEIINEAKGYISFENEKEGLDTAHKMACPSSLFRDRHGPYPRSDGWLRSSAE